MNKLLLTIVFVCCCRLCTLAQEKRFEYTDSSILNEPGSADLQVEVIEEEKDILSDTTIYINKVNIPADSVAAWRQNNRFAYLKNIDSLLKIKQQEALDAYKKSLKQRPNKFLQKLFSSEILQGFFWMIAIAFVIFILYKLFLSNGIFKRKTFSNTVNEMPAEEEIATVSDYDKLVHQSCKLGDYRMAVRYLFLKNLAQLADKEYVHFAPDKTNYQYVQEIPVDIKNEFASLVLTYEYAWYGNFQVHAESYQGIEKKFISFYNKIQ